MNANLSDLLFGREGEFELEARAMNAVCLLSAAVNIVVITQLILTGAMPHNIAIIFLNTLLFSGLYTLGRQGKGHGWILWIYLIPSLIVRVYDWGWVGGQYGLGLIAFVCTAAIVPVISRRDQVVWSSLSLVIAWLAFWIILFLRPDHFARSAGMLVPAHERLVYVTVMALGVFVLTCLTKDSFIRRCNEVMHLNDELLLRNTNLSEALAEVKSLRGIVPICAHCKSIRNDQGYYESVEKYMSRHTAMEFSHGFCPECMKTHYSNYLKEQRSS